MISLISSGYPIQTQKNAPSSEVHMEHSPGYTTSWVTNQTSVNLRKMNRVDRKECFTSRQIFFKEIKIKEENKNHIPHSS